MSNDRDEWREEALQAKHESGGSDITRQKRRSFLRRHSVSDDGNTEREEGKDLLEKVKGLIEKWQQGVKVSVDCRVSAKS